VEEEALVRRRIYKPAKIKYKVKKQNNIMKNKTQILTKILHTHTHTLPHI
jgi:hypothetical protein